MAEIVSLSVTDASNITRWPEGMAPSAINDAARADEGMLARNARDTQGYLTVGGTANAWTLTINSTTTALAAGETLKIKAAAPNTGAVAIVVTPAGGVARASVAVQRSTKALVGGETFTGGEYILTSNDGLTYQITGAEGLQLWDTNQSHKTQVVNGSNITADRTLTLTAGDADRTLDISAASVTVSAAAATVLDDATVAAMVDTLGGASATGTGGIVRANTPTLVTPILGVAAATSITLGGFEAMATYDEGTFTPSLRFGGASVSITYSDRTGHYTKMGNRCAVDILTALSANGSSVGVASIATLPFTVVNATYNRFLNALLQVVTYPAGGLCPYGYMAANSTVVTLAVQKSAAAGVDLADTNFAATSSVALWGTYQCTTS